MNIELRRQAMGSDDDRTIYLARNLICDGTNWFDTGFAPFTTENKNKDFRITLRFHNFIVTSSAVQDTIIACKYEDGSYGGQFYPGFIIRKLASNSTTIQVGGYNYWQPTIATVQGHNLYLWRKSGSFYAKSDYDGITRTLSVRVANIDHHILIGATQDKNSAKMRFGKFTMDYIRVEYI